MAMNPTNAKVRKTIIGKHEVTYDCPECGASLKNDLDDAGKNDTCPHCDCQFKVPGATFKAKLEKEKAEKEAEKAEQERQKEAERLKREAERKESWEAERLKAEEITRRSAVLASQVAADDEAERRKTKGEKKEPINYISQGLMHSASAVLYASLSYMFVSAAAWVDSFNGEKDAVILIVIIFLCLALVSFFGAFVSSIKAINAFREGSRPR
jgi:uncharacterized membrane protein YdbT with pleckstrin-like domain